MVGCEVGDHRHPGAVLHVHQLERTKLHHSDIFWLHLPHQRQQRRADVAAQPNCFPLCFQHFGNQGCGGGFSVRTGDGDNITGTNLKKSLHLRGDFCTPLTKRGYSWAIRMHTGRAEGDLGIHFLVETLAQVQLATHTLQLQYLGIQLFPFRPVAAENNAAVFQQQPYQRAIAYAQAKHCHGFPS